MNIFHLNIDQTKNMEYPELKHVKHYLDAGVEALRISKGMFTCDADVHEKIKINTRNIDCLFGKQYRVISCKLILRPLSDLTEEIEVNGEKFIPMTKLEELYPDHISVNPRPVMSNETIEMSYYKEYENLFEWHFDLFGLIEENKAVNINTI